MALKDDIFYRDEKIWFKDVSEYFLTDFAASIIGKKLIRKFNIPCKVKFRGNRQGGMAHFDYVNVSHNPSLRLLIHELAHVYDRQKNYRRSQHDYKLKDCMTELYNYAKLKDLWKNEIERKSAPKLEKPKPTKKDVQNLEIMKIQKRLKKIDSTIRRYINLKKKYERKLKRLIKQSN